MIEFPAYQYDCSASWRNLPYAERMKMISTMVNHWYKTY